MKKLKKVFAFLLTGLLVLPMMLSFTSCEKQSDKLTGFDVELARALVDELNEREETNLKVEFKEIDWNSKEALLENGTIDLIWNGLTITSEREAGMCISVPYLENKQVAVIRKSDAKKYTDIESINGTLVGAESGSAGETVILSSGWGDNYRQFSSQLDSLTNLIQGTINVAIIDSVMAGYYTSIGSYKNKIQIIDGLVFAIEQYGIAGRKEDKAFISKINDGLFAMRNEEYKEIAEKYGLTSETTINNQMVNPLKDATDNSWDKIKARGKIVVGYTIFAPIAFVETDGYLNNNRVIIGDLLDGLKTTSSLFSITLLTAIPLGLLLAFGSMSKFKPLKGLVKTIIWIIRGTPLMLQILAVSFIPSLFGILNVEFAGLFGLSMDGLMFLFVCVAFAINYACYFSEIMRAGIEGVPHGQAEAGHVLGLSKGQVFFHITLKQVIKKIVPPMSNEIITLVKDTSLASILGVIDLLSAAKHAVGTYVILMPFVYAAIFYLIFNGILTLLFGLIEKKLSYFKA